MKKYNSKVKPNNEIEYPKPTQSISGGDLIEDYNEFLIDFYEQVGIITRGKGSRDSIARVLNTCAKEYLSQPTKDSSKPDTTQSVDVENIRKRFVGRVESVLMKYYTVIEGKCLDDLLEVLYPDQPTKDSSNKLNESEGK